ncbi:MAG: acyl carrier protein [Clostridia bacterium]|nr:acyl carrier protein [Clostridia bacterium]MBQ6122907.1 acyl carrier protein [Clostridia bacterium]MBQ6327062.1 acyl carrier protein [Clostridia bacterium]MBQ9039593.1 acyl carrier protein [Clostridia bacterium]
MDELLSILKGICPKVDFVNEKKLIDDGILDSFDIISIVNELNEHYDIEIDVDDLEPDNFNTVEAMLELIEKLRNE